MEEDKKEEEEEEGVTSTEKNEIEQTNDESFDLKTNSAKSVNPLEEYDVDNNEIDQDELNEEPNLFDSRPSSEDKPKTASTLNSAHIDNNTEEIAEKV